MKDESVAALLESGDIRAAFTGNNIAQLARAHGISPRQVRNILKADGAA